MHRRTALIAAIAFVLGLATAAYTQEEHPHIVAAQNLLAQARDHLEKAAAEYGGHRLKAMDHIRQAEAELKEGLAFERSHQRR
jgi:hypothetical protein